MAIAFDFITDPEFRQSLANDYAEMAACMEGGQWKAVHVLSGSIVEALLADYLLGARTKGPDPRKMTLEKLIDECHAVGVLSERTNNLAAAIRSYRNLIHPGRMVRLKEEVNEEGARIAATLVAIIAREVAAKQEQVYGPTAEQLVRKFESDPSATSISYLLLEGAKDGEIERLLLDVLPSRYFSYMDQEEGDQDLDAMEALERLYRAGFERAPEAVRTKTAQKVVQVLKEEAGERVNCYEERFFVCADLAYLGDDERALIKTHILSRLKRESLPRLLNSLVGIGPYLDGAELVQLINSLLAAAVNQESNLFVAHAARERLLELYWEVPSEQDDLFFERILAWADFVGERHPELASRARSIYDEILVQAAPDDLAEEGP